MFPLNTAILIVDDSDTLLNIVKDELLALGFTKITTARDGREAIAKLTMAHKANASIGLIISDWVMPNMTGIDLLRTVRVHDDWRDVPFILLTSQNDMNQVTEAVFAGVSNYIIKPLAKGILKEKLEVAFKKSQTKA